MPGRIPLYTVPTLLLLAGAQSVVACETETLGFANYYRGGGAGELNDYGALLMDANNAGQWPTDCAKLAHDNLLSKLKGTPDSFFQQSLAGYYVALIFASSTRLGAQGRFIRPGIR